MHRYQKPIFWAIVVSETSHIFCCVLPALFSILSLLGGLGLMVAMPGWMESLHALMHRWEIPMIAASALVIALGWALHFFSRGVECRDHQCCHGHCDTRRRLSRRILIVATALLAFNLSVYFIFHRHQGEIEHYIRQEQVHENAHENTHENGHESTENQGSRGHEHSHDHDHGHEGHEPLGHE